MDGASTLYTAHDLSQSLQDKLESLPGVERAFVHVDYETDHTPVRWETEGQPLIESNSNHGIL